MAPKSPPPQPQLQAAPLLRRLPPTELEPLPPLQPLPRHHQPLCRQILPQELAKLRRELAARISHVEVVFAAPSGVIVVQRRLTVELVVRTVTVGITPRQALLSLQASPPLLLPTIPYLLPKPPRQRLRLRPRQPHLLQLVNWSLTLPTDVVSLSWMQERTASQSALPTLIAPPENSAGLLMKIIVEAFPNVPTPIQSSPML